MIPQGNPFVFEHLLQEDTKVEKDCRGWTEGRGGHTHQRVREGHDTEEGERVHRESPILLVTTLTIPTKICWLKLSGQLPYGHEISAPWNSDSA